MVKYYFHAVCSVDLSNVKYISKKILFPNIFWANSIVSQVNRTINAHCDILHNSIAIFLYY
jgi:hypothetical protein